MPQDTPSNLTKNLLGFPNKPNSKRSWISLSHEGIPTKYTFKSDMVLKGTNVVPKGSQMANFSLTRRFPKGTTITYKQLFLPQLMGMGINQPPRIPITFIVDGGMMQNGTHYDGKVTYSFYPSDDKGAIKLHPQYEIGKYRVIRPTPILKVDRKKKGWSGEPSYKEVGQLKKGDIVDVVKVEVGGKGVIPHRYLVLSIEDRTVINGYNAEKVDDDTSIGSNLKTNSVKEGYRKMTNNHIAIGLIVIVGGFLVYKIIKN